MDWYIKSEAVLGSADGRSAAVGSATPKSPTELREAERAILYWRQKVAQLGVRPPLVSLDLARMATRDWNQRFLIGTGSSDGGYAFLLYGQGVARLLDLPDEPVPQMPMAKQLPERYRPVFIEGCSEAAAARGPIRKSGRFEHRDGDVELFRAVFLPVGEGSDEASLIYGAINSRVSRTPPPVGSA